MLQYLRKAVSGSYIQDPRNSLVRDEYRKKLLKDNLSNSIKKLQKAHMNNSNPIVERNDEDANRVCAALEAIFLNEYLHRNQPMDLKNMFVEGIRTNDDETLHISFWELLKEVTHKDVVTQLKHLVVTTDVGLCRSWIRLALNDCLIVSYLDAILADRSHLSRFYATNAFLMDTELPFILKDFLQGLMHFEFRLNYNSSKLNTWDMEPLELAGIVKTEKRIDSKGEFSNQSAPTAKLKDVTTRNKRKDGDIRRRIPNLDSDNDSNLAAKEPPKLQSTPIKQTENTSKNNKEDELNTSKAKITVVADLPISANHSFLEVQHERHSKQEEEHNKQEEKSSSSVVEDISVDTDDDSHVSEKINNKNKMDDKESNDDSTDLTSSTTTESTNEEEHLVEPQPRVLGNRLGGSGWSGWSSQFEHNEEETVDEETPCEEGEINSFDSLLQIYGNKATTKSKDSSYIKKKSDSIDGEPKHKETPRNTKENVPEATSPTADPAVNQTFEIVPMNTSLHGDNVDKKTQSSLSQLTELGLEAGLDKQNFQCKHCCKAIGLIYGPYRVCYFDGGYYCFDCHDDEEYNVPAKIVQQWDFRKHKVSKYNKVFLMKIEEEPLFHMDELNPKLYVYVMSLKEVKLLRLQLQYLKEYVQTCRNEVAEDFRIRLWPREYLCDDIHQYSLLDLVQVNNGQLSHHLKKVISQFTRHIYKCTLCRQKGFICEYCSDEEIIYPFQIDTAVQCQGCLSTFHRACRQDKRCPKCVRIHLRSQSHQKDDMERRLTVATKEHNKADGVF